MNTSGGLKGCGHPVGATGVKQAVEIVWQLRGDAKERQVNGAEIGLTHNVGGSGATAVVHIFGRGGLMSMERPSASLWRKIKPRYNLIGNECENCGTAISRRG